MSAFRSLTLLAKALWAPFDLMIRLLALPARAADSELPISQPPAKQPSRAPNVSEERAGDAWRTIDAIRADRARKAAAAQRRRGSLSLSGSKGRIAIRLAVVVAVSVGSLMASLLAFSYFSTTSAGESNSVTAGVLGQGNTPSPVTTDGTTVTITVPTITVGGTEIPTYNVTRYTSAGASLTPISGTCTAPSGGTVTCTDVPGGGQWKYTDTPFFHNWVGTVSDFSATVITDITPPTSAITFPAVGGLYNTSGWAGGCLGTICGTGNDPGAGASGVHDVKVSIKGPGGTYWNGTNFTSGSEVTFTATGTTAWSYAFPSANFATTGGGDGSYTGHLVCHGQREQHAIARHDRHVHARQHASDEPALVDGAVAGRQLVQVGQHDLLPRHRRRLRRELRDPQRRVRSGLRSGVEHDGDARRNVDRLDAHTGRGRHAARRPVRLEHLHLVGGHRVLADRSGDRRRQRR